MTTRSIQKTVLVIEDEVLIREGLRALLQNEPFIKKIIEAGDKISFLEKFTHEIDLVLMDFRLPDTNGLELLNIIRKRNLSTKVIALTGLDGTELILNLLRAGVNGIVYKLDGYAEIRKTLQSVIEGESYYSSNVVRVIQKNAHRWDQVPSVALTAREAELVAGIASGLTTKEIAVKLKMAEGTIETYRNRLLKKANVQNTAELIAFAYRNGIL